MMNDRDKLIELIEQSEEEWTWNISKSFARTVADNILEDGWIKLPCRVGETLHLVHIDYEGNYWISECEVSSMITMLSIMRAYEEHTVVYMSTNKAAAKRKLEELKGDRPDETDN
jgi:hypothetical protein